jgi:hypothetical protein
MLASALGITLTEEETKKILEAKTINKDLQDHVVALEEEESFNKLAYKESLEEKMMQVREQECTAVVCATVGHIKSWKAWASTFS